MHVASEMLVASTAGRVGWSVNFEFGKRNSSGAKRVDRLRIQGVDEGVDLPSGSSHAALPALPHRLSRWRWWFSLPHNSVHHSDTPSLGDGNMRGGRHLWGAVLPELLSLKHSESRVDAS